MKRPEPTSPHNGAHHCFDVVVVGVRFAGLNRLRGSGFSAVAFQQAGGAAHVDDVASRTLFPSCNPWYLGINVPGQPRVFLPCPGMPAYVRKCDRVAANGCDGFTLDAAPVARGPDAGRRRPDAVQRSPAA